MSSGATSERGSTRSGAIGCKAISLVRASGRIGVLPWGVAGRRAMDLHRYLDDLVAPLEPGDELLPGVRYVGASTELGLRLSLVQRKSQGQSCEGESCGCFHPSLLIQCLSVHLSLLFKYLRLYPSQTIEILTLQSIQALPIHPLLQSQMVADCSLLNQGSS